MLKRKYTLALLAFLMLTMNALPLAAQQPATAQPAFRVVEDGGTGSYRAVMLTEKTLPTHTVFRPRDLSVFNGN